MKRIESQMEIDNYAVNSSLLSVNAGLKVLFGLLSLMGCLLSGRGILAVCIGILMPFITLKIGGIKWKAYAPMLMIPSSFILLSALVISVDISKVRLGYWDIPLFSYYLSVTKEAIEKAVRISIKAFAGVTCLYMMSLSTPLYEMIGVMRKCGVPEIMIELMYLIYRFVFVLLAVFHNMNTAAHARYGYSSFRHSYQSFFMICSNLLVVAFRKASAVFDAMEARGYDGYLRFLEKEKPVKKHQVVLFILYSLCIAFVLAGEKVIL